MSTVIVLVSSCFVICSCVTPLGPWKSGGQASWHQYAGYSGGTACGYLNVADYLSQHTNKFPYDMITAVGTVPSGSTYDNLFNNGEGCGACYEVQCVGEWANNVNCACTDKTVTVQAIDLSGENPEPHFDIAEDGFFTIAGSQCGRIAINYRHVACEFTDNIYITTDNNDDWSYYLNFYNVAGDGRLCGVELKSSDRGDNEWMQCVNINSKWKCDDSKYEPTALPLSFRLTDCSGNIITANDVVSSYGVIKADLGVNFPYESSGTTTTTTTTATTTTTPTTTTTTTKPTTTTSSGGSGSNINIINFGTASSSWYYAATVNDISSGYTLSTFEIKMTNDEWFMCIDQGWAIQCGVSAQIALPLSVRLTAKNGKILTADAVITDFKEGSVFDFGSNFGTTSASVTTTTTTTTAAPTTTTTKVDTGTTTTTTANTLSTSTSGARFVSFIGQVGASWDTSVTNEEFLKYIGVPGYGEGSKGYNVFKFAFWVSDSLNGGAAVNGAAYDWQNILSRITSTTLRQTLTGTSNPTAAQLRAGVKAIYKTNGISIFIAAFGANDQPMTHGKSATAIAESLAAYAKLYDYDGVDIDWEEGIVGKLGADGGGEDWLCLLTDTLRDLLNSDQKITHAPQAPYFRCDKGDYSCNYPNGGYMTVDKTCGGNIDWYNMQFYNQGTTPYSDYSGLFVQSTGWSTNSAVYELIDRGVAASKIIVGKHTSGDGSTFVPGSTLKAIFNEALAAGRWNAGFMTWQFYREVTFGSDSLIDHVKLANWPSSSDTTTSTTTTTTTDTTTTKASTTTTTTTIAAADDSDSSADDAKGCLITNRIGSTSWWYAIDIEEIPNGVEIDKVYLKSSGSDVWIEGKYTQWSGGYYTFSDNGPYEGPLSFKIVAKSGQIIISEDIIEDTTPGKSGRMDATFSGRYIVTNDEDNKRVKGSIVVLIILCCLVAIACIIGGVYYCSVKKRGSAYFKNAEDEDNVQFQKVSVSVDKPDTVEMMDDDGQQMITTSTNI